MPPGVWGVGTMGSVDCNAVQGVMGKASTGAVVPKGGQRDERVGRWWISKWVEQQGWGNDVDKKVRTRGGGAMGEARVPHRRYAEDLWA